MSRFIFRQAGVFVAVLFAICGQICPAKNPLRPTIPAAYFAKKPQLSSPNLSPNGRHLAVVVLASEGGESKYQLAILHVPDLKPVSRLDISPGCLPIDVNWVNDRRLVMGIGKERALYQTPRPTGEIVAIDFDGKNKRTLVGDRSHNSIGLISTFLNVSTGFASISGIPAPTNGHFYLTVNSAPDVRNAGAHVQRTLLYDVDAIYGNAKEIGSIYKNGYRFLVHEGVARYAYGLDDAFREHVYYRSKADDEWTEIDPDVVGKYFAPLFISPDGAKLYSIGNVSGGPNEFALSNLDGSKRVILASNPRADIGAVYRSPIPRSPYAATVNDGKPKIIYLDDSKYAKALRYVSSQYADHFVTFSDLSEGGEAAIVYAVSDRDAGSYALYDFQKATIRPLFQALPALNSEQLGERRPFWVRTDSGTVIGGFLNFPPSGVNTHLPTILMPHGGPINFANVWAMAGWEEREAQFLATRGYLVVQVNYRGSAGRGRNFADSGKLQVASGMLQDQLDALALVIEDGYADKERVCVYGASYGGYAAYQLPIYAPPNTFKCSIAFAAVSDIRLQSEQDRYDMTLLRETWGMDDPLFVKSNSPIHNIDKFDVPVLIIHGQDDPVVAVRNPLLMMDALARKGRPFASLIRAKEGHGFSNEQANTDRYEAIANFLQKQLGE